VTLAFREGLPSATTLLHQLLYLRAKVYQKRIENAKKFGEINTTVTFSKVDRANTQAAYEEIEMIRRQELHLQYKRTSPLPNYFIAAINRIT